MLATLHRWWTRLIERLVVAEATLPEESYRVNRYARPRHMSKAEWDGTRD